MDSEELLLLALARRAQTVGRTLRLQMGLSQAEVASAVGCDRAQIARWETGVTLRPRRDSALAYGALIAAWLAADE
ncbi:MAG TPA: helix-turn-helix transcriptional regulator [Candidatus Acidoferrales bacterium]|nr:helix-turn-helix transcriptional regulator [Candidatus Acidoferrales bacterium]